MSNLSYDNENYCRYLLGDVAGVPPGEVGVTWQNDTFTGNAVTTAFTLTYTPSADYPVVVLVGGVQQGNPEVWSSSGTTLTFVAAPANAAAISVVYCY